MPKKITKEEFQITINKLFPDEEIEILDYSKASAKGKYRCNICGQVFSIYKMGDLKWIIPVIIISIVVIIAFMGKGMASLLSKDKKKY